MNRRSPTTVVIADDDAAVRGALAGLITACGGLELIGVARTGGEAAELCARHRPDVAVVDVMMPGGGTRAIAGIRGVSPTTAVVVFTARSDRRTRTLMLDAGAVLVLAKGGHHDLADEIMRIAPTGISRPTDRRPEHRP